MSLLKGIRVLDLTRFVSGPFCTMMLGDLGADVIKVEQPGAGDNTRKWTSSQAADPPYFLSVNLNKRSITLDFRRKRGREILLRLAAKSDVVIHNLRPGTFESHDLSYEKLQAVNPKIILCEITGYGKTGPEKERGAFDLTIQAESGLMSVNGEPDGMPTKVGVPVTDIMTSMMACIGIEAALVNRERTGKGSRISTSMIESALAMMPNVVTEYLVGGVVPVRTGHGHPNVSPYGIFKASDGWVTMAVGTEGHWAPYCRMMGLPDLIDDPRFARNSDRLVNRDALNAYLNPIVATQPRSYWRDQMAAIGLPSAPVNTVVDSLASPQIEALGTVQTVTHPQLGAIRMIRSPLQVDEEYLPIRLAPPTLGQHSDEVLRELAGLDDAEIRSLREEGSVG